MIFLHEAVYPDTITTNTDGGYDLENNKVIPLTGKFGVTIDETNTLHIADWAEGFYLLEVMKISEFEESGGMIRELFSTGTWLSITRSYVQFEDNTFEITHADVYDGEVTVQISVYTAEPIVAKFVVACYDADGRMLGIKTATETIGSETTTVRLDYPTGMNEEDVASYKIMAIDSETFNPFCPAIEGTQQ